MIAICQNVPMGAEDKLFMQHRLRKHNILVKAFPNQVGSRLPMDPARVPLPLPTQTQHLSPEGTSDSSPPLAALSSGAYTAIRG